MSGRALRRCAYLCRLNRVTMLFVSMRFKALVLGVLAMACLCRPTSVAQPLPALPPNLLTLPAASYEIDMVWQGDSVNSRWEPRYALLLPVTIPGCNRQFYMQFDTGSPSTLFYRAKLQQIQARFPKTVTVADTASTLSAFAFRVGAMPVSARQVKLIDYASAAIHWEKPDEITIIGTIGTDFVENRVIGIDYPARKLFTGLTTPAKWSDKVRWADFIFANRAILLPAQLRGKNTLLYFDTGSSAYALLTDKKTTDLLAIPGAQREQNSSRSWNRTLTANSVATADSMLIAFHRLPIRSATYVEGSTQRQIDQMMKMGMGGMTGNKLFTQSILLLDTRTKKFALLGL